MEDETPVEEAPEEEVAVLHEEPVHCEGCACEVPSEEGEEVAA